MILGRQVKVVQSRALTADINSCTQLVEVAFALPCLVYYIISRVTLSVEVGGNMGMRCIVNSILAPSGRVPRVGARCLEARLQTRCWHSPRQNRSRIQCPDC